MILFGDINKGVKEYKSTTGAVLVDVRERTEFASGHIMGAINEPLSMIPKTSLPKEVPLFLYCLRGSRSRKAASILKKMGYEKVKSIGGINRYKGELVR
ncbi:MAG: rhodanese-like domain-containing protein [Blautia sp.]|nr:rhodanese-like domain-containing protein [Blautia sp.]